LNAFPIVKKEHVVQEKDSFMAGNDVATSTRDTSGTTGERLTLYGNDAELRAISALVRLRSAHLPNETQVMLRVLPPLSRMSDTRRSPATSGIYSLPVTLHGIGTLSWFDSIDYLLERIYTWYSFERSRSRPSMIHITPPPLLGFLSEELHRRGVSLSESPIKDFALTGGTVPPYIRRWVEQEWQARCHSIYSCTEILGDAVECRQRPNVYHVGPSMWAEVVDLVTSEPVNPGEHGMLVLTSYYPFQIVMPMIRYRTGDVVELCKDSCSCGDLGLAFRCIGREGQIVDLSDHAGRRYFLGSAKLETVCDGIPQIPKFPFPRFNLVRQDTNRHSKLCFNVETIRPDTFDIDRVSAAIRERLITECEILSPDTECGQLTIDVSVHGKGTLHNYFKLYPDR
jgi:phenylacetate-coenzyme A ligase PaaK-like adenylate-forming protein